MPTKQEHESTKELLTFLIEQFNKNDVLFWLDCGSVLKFIRNGSIIPSSDIDIGVWQNQVDQVLTLCNCLREKKFKMRFQRGLPFLEDQVRILIPESYHTPFRFIDILLYKKWGDEAVQRQVHYPCKHLKYSELWEKLFHFLLSLSQRNQTSKRFITRFIRNIPFYMNKISCNLGYHLFFYLYIQICKTVWYVVPLQYFEKLVKIDLYGFQINIPSHTEKYLEFRYGKKWKIYDKNWRAADGEYIRFRKPNLIPGSEVIKRKVKSDLFLYQPKVTRGTFYFTSEEIERINELDRDKNSLILS